MLPATLNTFAPLEVIEVFDDDAAQLGRRILVGIEPRMKCTDAGLNAAISVDVDAGLDALFGAGRAWLEGRFADRVFVTSFFWNVVVACLLVFLGTQLGVGSAMTTAVVVVLGIRIFSNTASIRRLLLKA